jgi:anti-sigma-K factor RskA
MVALTICLAPMLVWVLERRADPPTVFVAELKRAAGTTTDEIMGSNPGAPFFVVMVDLKAREFTVQPVADQLLPQRSYHLWLLPQGTTIPISLGLISHSASRSAPWPFSGVLGDLTNATLEVTLEPEGGSPRKRPTGPVVFLGGLFHRPG